MPDAIWAIRIDTFEIDTVMVSEQKWTVSAHSVANSCACPHCQQESRQVHTYYSRTLRDLPVDGRAVELVLAVRRFKCLNDACPKQTFAERLSELTLAHAQRTTRFTAALRAIGFVMNGEAGAKLAAQLYLPTSGDTLLRIVHRTPVCIQNTPRVMGVDDWAFRRGQVYGTILIDLDRHCPIDLLEGRTAEGLSQWLQHHPGVEIMTRDRSTEFARGMHEGNANAMQVADRWHLLHNLREALERMLNRIRQALIQLPHLLDAHDGAGIPVCAQLTRRAPSEEALKGDRRAQRQRRFDQVKALRTQGCNILQIAQRLKMSRVTARAFFYADQFPERAPRRRQASILDGYAHDLHTLWHAGQHNGMQLWREIKAMGYTGSHRPVYKWVRLRREEPAPTTPVKYRTTLIETQPTRPAIELPSPKKMSWLLVRNFSDLAEADAVILKHIQQHPLVAQGYVLAQQFGRLVREHLHESFEAWLRACDTSSIPDLASFAAGLRKDFCAVFAALKTGWSNGQTEGQVNRLKTIKRSMYGRASFNLLRLKVLYRPP
jgi:transposase